MSSPADPYRFEDRSGHYGTGHADLAPVSATAVAPRGEGQDRPIDPMGAAPDDGSVPPSRSDDRAEALAQAEPAPSGRSEVSDAIASSQTASTTMDAEIGVEAATGFETSVISPMPLAPSDDQTTLRLSTDIRAEAEASAGTEASGPVGSGGPAALLTPPMSSADQDDTTAFADMAARMDMMLAEMAARMQEMTAWPRDVGSPSDSAVVDDDPAGGPSLLDLPRGDDLLDRSDEAFADAQGRLDELFDTLPTTGSGDATDPLADGRGRLDDLLAGIAGPRIDEADADSLGSPMVTPPSDGLPDARERLEALKTDFSFDRFDADPPSATEPHASEESSPEPASFLARLFDGDAAEPLQIARADPPEPFESLGDLVMAPTAFDLPKWDDLLDFG